MARRPAQRAKAPTEKRAEDRKAATWFDAGVAAFGKADAYADELAIDKGELSKMRSGDTVALRRLLPMQKHAPSALAFCEAFLAEVEVAESPDQVLALVCPLLEAIGFVARLKKPEISEADLGLMLLRGLNDGSSVTRRLIENIVAPHGVSPKQVDAVLNRNGEPK